VESVPAFLDELAGRLVPACDPAVVRAVFARASAGYDGPRGRDGLRVTAITPSGVPFEASVTGGAGRSSASLRYVTEVATAMPFFGPRLAAQRAALDDLVGWLPPAARAAAGELRAAVDVLFPDPTVVPARTRFATTFGVVHRADVPGGIAGLKLYGNLRAGGPGAPGGPGGRSSGDGGPGHPSGVGSSGDGWSGVGSSGVGWSGVGSSGGPGSRPSDGPVSRLADRWPAVRVLGELVGGLAFLVPHFATVEVDAGGRLGHKLYLRTRRANPADLTVVARRFGADLGPVADALRGAGVDDGVWHRQLFVCAALGPSAGGAGGDGGGHEPEVSVHLSAKALGLDAPGMAGLARRLVERHGDTGGLDALAASTAAAGGDDAWTTTVIGLGLASDGVGKVNVYAAPTAPAPPAGDGQTYSNSGWTGSRLTA
jgi:hypothetical protein